HAYQASFHFVQKPISDAQHPRRFSPLTEGAPSFAPSIRMRVPSCRRSSPPLVERFHVLTVAERRASTSARFVPSAARMPASPSTFLSLASLNVGATIAQS